jgi:hypothetical protein
MANQLNPNTQNNIGRYFESNHAHVIATNIKMVSVKKLGNSCINKIQLAPKQNALRQTLELQASICNLLEKYTLGDNSEL